MENKQRDELKLFIGAQIENVWWVRFIFVNQDQIITLIPTWFIWSRWSILDNCDCSWWSILDNCDYSRWSILDNCDCSRWSILDNCDCSRWSILDNRDWSRRSFFVNQDQIITLFPTSGLLFCVLRCVRGQWVDRELGVSKKEVSNRFLQVYYRVRWNILWAKLGFALYVEEGWE